MDSTQATSHQQEPAEPEEGIELSDHLQHTHTSARASLSGSTVTTEERGRLQDWARTVPTQSPLDPVETPEALTDPEPQPNRYFWQKQHLLFRLERFKRCTCLGRIWRAFRRAFRRLCRKISKLAKKFAEWIAAAFRSGLDALCRYCGPLALRREAQPESLATECLPPRPPSPLSTDRPLSDNHGEIDRHYTSMAPPIGYDGEGGFESHMPEQTEPTTPGQHDLHTLAEGPISEPSPPATPSPDSSVLAQARMDRMRTLQSNLELIRQDGRHIADSSAFNGGTPPEMCDLGSLGIQGLASSTISPSNASTRGMAPHGSIASPSESYAGPKNLVGTIESGSEALVGSIRTNSKNSVGAVECGTNECRPISSVQRQSSGSSAAGAVVQHNVDSQGDTADDTPIKEAITEPGRIPGTLVHVSDSAGEDSANPHTPAWRRSNDSSTIRSYNPEPDAQGHDRTNNDTFNPTDQGQPTRRNSEGALSFIAREPERISVMPLGSDSASRTGDETTGSLVQNSSTRRNSDGAFSFIAGEPESMSVMLLGSDGIARPDYGTFTSPEPNPNTRRNSDGAFSFVSEEPDRISIRRLGDDGPPRNRGRLLEHDSRRPEDTSQRSKASSSTSASRDSNERLHSENDEEACRLDNLNSAHLYEESTSSPLDHIVAPGPSQRAEGPRNVKGVQAGPNPQILVTDEEGEHNAWHSVTEPRRATVVSLIRSARLRSMVQGLPLGGLPSTITRSPSESLLGGLTYLFVVDSQGPVTVVGPSREHQRSGIARRNSTGTLCSVGRRGPSEASESTRHGTPAFGPILPGPDVPEPLNIDQGKGRAKEQSGLEDIEGEEQTDEHEGRPEDHLHNKAPQDDETFDKGKGKAAESDFDGTHQDS